MIDLNEDKLIEKADNLAAAIAEAEGFFKEGSLPHRVHNPGDMELGDRLGLGTEQGKTIYAKADPTADIEDQADGYSALRRECMAILSGGSRVYSVNDTFVQLALTWTGGDNPQGWCEIVCGRLKIQESMTLREYVLG